ncbi:hypothetical protein HZS_7309 [Henneguya salminicola]|nr:hypothetical protein HZS_7309 [Henneguya salminicola]
MGINQYIYIISSIFLDMFFTMIIYIPVVFIIKKMNLIEYTNMFIIFYLAFCIIFATYSSFNLIISIFKNASNGIVVGLITLFVGCAPGLVIRMNSIFKNSHFFQIISTPFDGIIYSYILGIRKLYFIFIKYISIRKKISHVSNFYCENFMFNKLFNLFTLII